MSPAYLDQGIFSPVTHRDWSVGNQHGELENLEVTGGAKSDMSTWACWLGDKDGYLDASSYPPLLPKAGESPVFQGGARGLGKAE